MVVAVAGGVRVVEGGTRGVAGEMGPVAAESGTRVSSPRLADRTVCPDAVVDSAVTSSAVLGAVHRGRVPGDHKGQDASKIPLCTKVLRNLYLPSCDSLGYTGHAVIVAQAEVFARGTYQGDRKAREMKAAADMVASQAAVDQTRMCYEPEIQNKFYLTRVMRGSIHRVSLGRHGTGGKLGIAIRD